MRIVDGDDIYKRIKEEAINQMELSPSGRFDIAAIAYAHAGEMIKNAPTIDAAPVIHGYWKFTPYSFYVDEEFPDGIVYVVANCSECGGKHPNFAEVYSHKIYRPEEYEYSDDWEFDEVSEKDAAIEEAEKRRNKLSTYCNHCGARMDKKTE